MTKVCSVCGTENRDDALFCRSCGTAFPPLAGSTPDVPALAAGITCDECGFENKPGVRYCANCGVSLLGTVIVPRGHAGAAPTDAYGTTSPPPISYPSFAPVAPYPPAPRAGSLYPPVSSTSYPSTHDDVLPVPEVPDPAAALAAARMRSEGDEAVPRPAVASPFGPPPKPSRIPILAGGIVAALVIAGGVAWWFMSSSKPAPVPPVEVVAPAPVPAPAPSASPVEMPAAAIATPPTAASDIPVPVPDQPASSPTAGLPSAAETVLAPTAAPSPADDEARKLATQKRRDKAAKDKADRDAKLIADQQAQAARAEQEAAKRRADDAARAKAAAAAKPVPAPVVAPPQPRGVKEICAGKGTIGESICQSRECGAPEHAGEAICKQVKEREDRQRN